MAMIRMRIAKALLTPGIDSSSAFTTEGVSCVTSQESVRIMQKCSPRAGVKEDIEGQGRVEEMGGK